jgi:hypothetical protein
MAVAKTQKSSTFVFPRIVVVLLLALAACADLPPDETLVLPTLAVLPSLTPSDTPTLTPTPSPTTRLTPTPSPTFTRTATFTPSPTLSVTPSATITDTPTATGTSLPTVTPPNAGLGALALTALAVTLPPTVPRTPAPSPTFFVTPPGGAVPPGALPTFTALPLSSISCSSPPAATLSLLISGDTALINALGCPLNARIEVGGAAQAYERGVMLYVSGSPGLIYALSSDGRFRRFFDTWTPGLDPESGGEIPPPGLIEPIRGFGKVWRTNPDIRAALGWASSSEQGGTFAAQYFERGRALYLSVRGETYVLVDNPDGLSGTWRAFAGGF